MFGWSVCIHSLPFGSSGLQSSTVAGSDAGTIGQALEPSTIEEGRVGPHIHFLRTCNSTFQIFWDAAATNLSVVISSRRAIKDQLSSWNINCCHKPFLFSRQSKEKNWTMKTPKRSMTAVPEQNNHCRENDNLRRQTCLDVNFCLPFVNAHWWTIWISYSSNLIIGAQLLFPSKRFGSLDYIENFQDVCQQPHTASLKDATQYWLASFSCYHSAR